MSNSNAAVTPILDVRDLNVYYGESHILRDVDLSVLPGKIVYSI